MRGAQEAAVYVVPEVSPASFKSQMIRAMKKKLDIR